jgi:hypothetical protein
MRDTPETTTPATALAAFTPLADFYVWLQQTQIAYAKRALDTYTAWLKQLGFPADLVDYHSHVVSSAIDAPDAKARAWAVRFTSGGFTPAN